MTRADYKAFGEQELWERFKRNGDEKARAELILRHLKLVDFWAREMSSEITWVEKEDLLQIGTLGLMKAVDRFDHTCAYKLTTYASPWITGEIWNSPEVRRGIPKGQNRRSRKIRKMHDELMEKFDRPPTNEEIAAETGFTPQQVSSALRAMAIGFPDTYDQIPETQQEQLAVDACVTEIDVETLLASSVLNEQDRTVLILFYWERLNDKGTGENLQRAPNYVKLIRKRALDKLRKYVKEGGSNEA